MINSLYNIGFNAYDLGKNAASWTLTSCLEIHPGIAIAANCTLLGGYLVYQGAKELANRQITKGVTSMLVGVGAIAASGYYAYSELLPAQPQAPKETHSAPLLLEEAVDLKELPVWLPPAEENPPPLMTDKVEKVDLCIESDRSVMQEVDHCEGFMRTFLNNRLGEIAQMRDSRVVVANWTKIGEGVSKLVYTHPDLPGWVIKAPKHSSSSYWMGNDISDIQLNYQKMQGIKQFIEKNQIDHFVTPNSYICPTSLGQIGVEEQLSFEQNVPKDTLIAANKELEAFTNATKLCDISLEKSHNAQFISGSMNSSWKVGIYDFDCEAKNMEIGLEHMLKIFKAFEMVFAVLKNINDINDIEKMEQLQKMLQI